MSASKITYINKVVGDKWKTIDANEIKAVVNAHADDIDRVIDLGNGTRIKFTEGDEETFSNSIEMQVWDGPDDPTNNIEGDFSGSIVWDGINDFDLEIVNNLEEFTVRAYGALDYQDVQDNDSPSSLTLLATKTVPIGTSSTPLGIDYVNDLTNSGVLFLLFSSTNYTFCVINIASAFAFSSPYDIRLDGINLTKQSVFIIPNIIAFLYNVLGQSAPSYIKFAFNSGEARFSVGNDQELANLFTLNSSLDHRVKNVKVTVAPSGTWTANSFPIIVIPAPGENKIIEVRSIAAKLTYGTQAYAFGTARLELGATVYGNLASCMNSVQDAFVSLGNVGGVGGGSVLTGASIPVNTALKFKTGTNSGIGNGQLTLYISYMILDMDPTSE